MHRHRHDRARGTRCTGDSGGWQQVAFDLSAFAGKQVEVSISYVTDPAFGAVGVFVDDTRVTAGGATLDAEGFETGLGVWAPTGAAGGQPGRGERVRPLAGACSARRSPPGTRCCSGSASSRSPRRPSGPRLLRPVLRYLLR